ncbi:MAG: hypothetical protein O3A29_19310, partial [Planctomycetota bacterium]|nr:hypothetical protein [Planctomycetota bacterium]
MNIVCRSLSWGLPLFLVLAGVAARGDESLTFNRDIRPILAANCFACHGLDAKHRQAELRL